FSNVMDASLSGREFLVWKRILSRVRVDSIDNHAHLIARSLDQRDERLAFLDDMRRKLRPVGAADVPRRVRNSGRNEQDVAGLDVRRLAADLVFQRTLEKIDDLFTWMRVPIFCRPALAEARRGKDEKAAGERGRQFVKRHGRTSFNVIEMQCRGR